ncbi:MAG: hypothetical protein OYL41_00790 [Acidobacteriota bacterium]|nr:hypothetical protein [Acidobacteriota bacterium]
MIAALASGGKVSGKVPRGSFVVAGILALATGLGLLAVAGKPTAIRRPDSVDRPVLLVPDFDNRTGRGEFTALARQLTDAVRARLERDPGGIFELSPRRLRPAFGPSQREEGLVGIAGRLGADYVLAGSLESGRGEPLGPGSSWTPPREARGGGEEIRLDVLLVRDSDPPHVFAERFLLGSPDPEEAEDRLLADWVGERIALSLSRP